MKVDKRRFKFVVPATVAVGVGAVYMLINQYSEVPTLNKAFIVIGAMLFSSVISYFLFPTNDENSRNDRGPY